MTSPFKLNLKNISILLGFIVLLAIIFLCGYKASNFIKFYSFSTKPISSSFAVTQLPTVPGQPIHWVKTLSVSNVTKAEHLLAIPKGASQIKISTTSVRQLSLAPTKILSKTELVKLALANSQSEASQALAKQVERERAYGLLASLNRSITKMNALFATVGEVTMEEEAQTTEETTLVDLAPIVEEATGEEITPEEVIEEDTTASVPSSEITPLTPSLENEEEATTTEEVIEETPTAEIPVVTETDSRGGGSSSLKEKEAEIITDQATTTDLSATSTASSTDLVLVEYETPAPVIAEADTETGKIVTVSSTSTEQEVITNVLAFTTIPEIFKVGQEDKIQIKWTNNGDQNVTFHAYDTNNNGKLDYVEWTVPHLSTQTFEIIFISKAFELDANKEIINDVYEQTVAKDNVWVAIPAGHYIRATFEQNLTAGKDMTIYAKGQGTITVFNENRNDSIGEFTINGENTYKIFPSYTDSAVYDLLFSGNIEVDYIVDPTSFVAVQAGAMDDGATFGNTSPGTVGVDFPGSTDSVDLAGFALTQGTVTQLAALSDTVGGGQLTVTDDFNGGTVTDAKIYVNSDLTGKTISGTISYSGSGNAIEIGSSGVLGDFAGSLTNSGSGNGIYNGGTITSLSGTVTNSGGGYGVYNGGIVDDLTANIINNGTSYGFYNAGTVTSNHSVIDANYGTVTTNEIVATGGIYGEGGTINFGYADIMPGSNYTVGNMKFTFMGVGDLPTDSTFTLFSDGGGNYYLTFGGTFTGASLNGNYEFSLENINPGGFIATGNTQLTVGFGGSLPYTTIDVYGGFNYIGSNTSLPGGGINLPALDIGEKNIYVTNSWAGATGSGGNVITSITNKFTEISAVGVVNNRSGGTVTTNNGTVNEYGGSVGTNGGTIHIREGLTLNVTTNNGNIYLDNDVTGDVDINGQTVALNGGPISMGTLSDTAGTGRLNVSDIFTATTNNAKVHMTGGDNNYFNIGTNNGTLYLDNTFTNNFDLHGQQVTQSGGPITMATLNDSIGGGRLNTNDIFTATTNNAAIHMVGGDNNYFNITTNNGTLYLDNTFTNNFDLHGQQVTQSGGPITMATLNDSIGGGRLNTNDIFTATTNNAAIHMVGGDNNYFAITTNNGTLYLDNTFTGTFDLYGQQVTQSGGAITMTALNDTVGGGQLTVTDDFNGGTVTDAKLYVNSDLTGKTISGTISYSGSSHAIEVAAGAKLGGIVGSLTLGGCVNNTAISNRGTIGDISTTITNNGCNVGINNADTGVIFSISGTVTNYGYQGITNWGSSVITEISGTVTNYSTSGNGIVNEYGGTITNISGVVNNTNTGIGIKNYFATITDISGTVSNTSTGIGIDNYGTITNISGTVDNTSTGIGIDNSGTITTIANTAVFTNSGGGKGIDNDGTITDFSGTVDNTSTGIGINNYIGGTITYLQGTITNTGFSGVYNYGTIVSNYILVDKNWATVTTNESTGIVNLYYGSNNVGTNNGIIHIVNDYNMGLDLTGMTNNGTIYLDNTFTGTLDLGGKSVTQSGGAITMTSLVDTIGGGQLTVTDDFDGGTVTDAKLYVNSDLTGKTISGTISYSGSSRAIEVAAGAKLGGIVGSLTLGGCVNNTAISNRGTIGDISTTITNNGCNVGINNADTGVIFSISGTVTNYGYKGITNWGGSVITEISGTVTNYSTSGNGIVNEYGGTITNISGVVNNTNTGIGIKNYFATITDISGTVNNTSTGTGIINSGALNGFTGTLTGNDPLIDNTSGTINGGTYPVTRVFANSNWGGTIAAFPATIFTDDDTTPPIGTITLASGATYSTTTSPVITLTTDDADQYQLCLNSATSTNNCTSVARAWSSYTATPTAYNFGSDGAKTLYVQFKDVVGNISQTYSDGIIVDTVAPTLNFVSIYSNNASTTLAKVGDQITLEFTSPFSLFYIPTVTIGGQSAPVYQGVDDKTWYTLYTLAGTEAEGNLGLTINYHDLAGNPGIQVTVVTDGSAVRTDFTGPTLSFTDNVEAGPVSFDTITADWGDASVKKWDYDADGTCSTSTGDYTKINTDSLNQSNTTNNNKYICLYGEDAVGNKTTLVSANDINIDATTPIQSNWSPANSSTINDSTPTITFDLNENGDCRASLLDDSYDLMSDDVDCTGDGTTSISCTLSDLGADGSKTIYLACKDTAGNKDSNSTNTALTYTLDTTGPTLSFTDNVEAGLVSSDTITPSWGDATVTKWDYDVDGTCSTSTGDYTKINTDSLNQSNTTNNNKYICLYGEDAVGNKSTQVSANDISISSGGGSNIPTCVYTESAWSPCVNSKQTRTLTAINQLCLGEDPKTEEQSCLMPPDPTLPATSTATSTPFDQATSTATTTLPLATSTPVEATTTLIDNEEATTTVMAEEDSLIEETVTNLVTSDNTTPTNPTDQKNSHRSGGGEDKTITETLLTTLDVGTLIEDNIAVLGTTTEKIILGTKKALESPTGAVVTNTIITVGVVGGGVAASGVLAMSGTAVADILFLPFKLWGLLLSALGLKKRNRPWGTVYDSVTKQPLDPAYVTLKNLETGREVTSITDLDGRYGFLVAPGKYVITANKTNYTFPSEKLAGKTSDVLYNNLYFGGEIPTAVTGAVINKNIPLDPIKFDWNEFAKNKKQLMKFYSRREKIMRLITDWLFRVGCLISFVSLLLVSAPYNYIIFTLYLLLVLLRQFGLKQKTTGSLTDQAGNPLSYALIRVFDAELKVEITNKVADRIGHYYCLVNKGKYYVKIEKKNDDESYTEVFTSPVFEADKGIVNESFVV